MGYWTSGYWETNYWTNNYWPEVVSAPVPESDQFIDIVIGRVEISNMALSLIGKPRIGSVSKQNESGKVCDVFFDHTRDEILEDFEWSFAIKTKELNAVTTENLTRFEYKYILPEDCIKVLSLINIENEYEYITTPEWIREENYIYTDHEDVGIKYIGQYNQYSKWSTKAREIFALKLASKIAVRLAGSHELSNYLLRQYMGKLYEAEGHNAVGAKNPQYAETEWVETY